MSKMLLITPEANTFIIVQYFLSIFTFKLSIYLYVTVIPPDFFINNLLVWKLSLISRTFRLLVQIPHIHLKFKIATGIL